MTQEEIIDRMGVCPWRESRREGPYVCTRYIGAIIPCNGACSLVVDYATLKELETKKVYERIY